jgi:predicted metal-dependent phosphoesterase TrpH
MYLDNVETIALKADMHLHTNEDPQDSKKINYSSHELIDYLARNNFDVFSITLHNHMFEKGVMDEVISYAKNKGLIMIPGIEKTIEQNHVLIYNMDKECAEKISTYPELKKTFLEYGIRDIRKRDSILIVASHPHYPSKSAINNRLFDLRRLFHGLEYNSFYLKWDILNFNKQTPYEAERWGKALMGNTDAHRLEQIGNTYTNIHVPPSVFTFEKIKDRNELKEIIRYCSAEEYERINRTIICYIKKGQILVNSRPLDLKYVIKTVKELFG